MSKTLYEEKKEEIKAEPEEFIIEGEEKNYITFTKDSTKITYNAIDKTYSYKNPEEKVRASFYVELIEKYNYPENRLDTEVVVPRRTLSDNTDIVNFKNYIILDREKVIKK